MRTRLEYKQEKKCRDVNLKKSQSKCNSYVKNRVINPAGLDVICNSKFQSGWEKLQIEGHLPPDLGRRRRGLQLCQFLHSLRNHCTNLFVNFHLINSTRKTTPTHPTHYENYYVLFLYKLFFFSFVPIKPETLLNSPDMQC